MQEWALLPRSSSPEPESLELSSQLLARLGHSHYSLPAGGGADRGTHAVTGVGKAATAGGGGAGEVRVRTAEVHQVSTTPQSPPQLDFQGRAREIACGYRWRSGGRFRSPRTMTAAR